MLEELLNFDDFQYRSPTKYEAHLVLEGLNEKSKVGLISVVWLALEKYMYVMFGLVAKEEDNKPGPAEPDDPPHGAY